MTFKEQAEQIIILSNWKLRLKRLELQETLRGGSIKDQAFATLCLMLIDNQLETRGLTKDIFEQINKL